MGDATFKGPIPEEIQRPLRERFKFIRESHHINRWGLSGGGSSNLKNWEEVDFSGMSMRVVYRLAQSIGCSIEELFAGLAAGARESAIENPKERTLIAFFRNLPEEYQDHVLRTTEDIMDLIDKNRQQKRLKEKERKESYERAAQDEPAVVITQVRDPVIIHDEELIGDMEPELRLDIRSETS